MEMSGRVLRSYVIGIGYECHTQVWVQESDSYTKNIRILDYEFEIGQ